MTKTINIYQLLAAVIVVAGIFLAYIFGIGQSPAFGSTPSEASDYSASSTAPSAAYGAQTVGSKIKAGSGSFGSVIITGANTGILNFYNATTSNINLRIGNTASTAILLTSIPASAAAGTYTFDIGFTSGLLMVLESGIMPTSTVTWR